MYLTRLPLTRSDDGQVLAIVAVSMVVFLLFAALVFDVGNWFSHKRQLQNRADAAALAAGVGYQTSWPACIAGDATVASAIIGSARTYAGDPSATNPVNTETADQSKLNVVVNSPSYDAGTDFTDGALGDTADPCYLHPASSDPISPNGGYWTDVKVKERDLGSFFGRLGIPLSRNVARARVQIHPAISFNGFLPLAVPDSQIEKAQIRYYNECTYNPNNPNASLLATADLRPLSSGYQTTSGDTLWGPAVGNPLPADVSPIGVALTLPSSLNGCPNTLDYVPVGVEIRFTSEPNVDINSTCGTLATARFADCFRRVSQIRAYPAPAGGDTTAAPKIRAVSLSGCSPDAYFSRPSTGSCSLGVNVDVDWGDRDDGPLNVPANFTVTANSVALAPVGPLTGTWTGTGIPAGSGANPVAVTLNWSDRDPTHTWRPPPTPNCLRNQNANPCKYIGQPIDVHRSFVGTEANAGAADLVRTSESAQVSGGQPQPAYSSGTLGSPLTVFPTLGLRLALKTGDFTILRQSGSQATQLLDCEPPGGGGTSEIRKEFALGCVTWYGKNPFTQGDWWNTTTQSCPRSGDFFLDPAPPPYTNGNANPFRCVPTVPGSRGNPVSDGIKIRTGNCVGNVNLASYTCQGNPPCSNPNTYNPATRTYAPGGNKQRVVNLFIVPYQALKGASGSNQEEVLPILGGAAFYITGWGGSGSSADQCTTDPDGTGPARPDDPALNGEIVGYFIEDVQFNTGPVDPTVTCVIGQLTPCRAVLVR